MKRLIQAAVTLALLSSNVAWANCGGQFKTSLPNPFAVDADDFLAIFNFINTVKPFTGAGTPNAFAANLEAFWRAYQSDMDEASAREAVLQFEFSAYALRKIRSIAQGKSDGTRLRAFWAAFLNDVAESYGEPTRAPVNGCARRAMKQKIIPPTDLADVSGDNFASIERFFTTRYPQVEKLRPGAVTQYFNLLGQDFGTNVDVSKLEPLDFMKATRRNDWSALSRICSTWRKFERTRLGPR